MSQQHSKPAVGAVSPLLALLIHALEMDDTKDRSNEARALRAFGELAVQKIPMQGVFGIDEGELYSAIDRIAREHLGFSEPRAAFFAATAAVEECEKRDAIETAANHLGAVSDEASFYADLAFGVTLVDFGSVR